MSPERYVFNSDKVGRFHRLAGSEFQNDGATKLNEGSPKDLKIRFGIFRIFSFEDRRVHDGQFFVGAQNNGSKFATDNSNYIRRFFYNPLPPLHRCL